MTRPETSATAPRSDERGERVSQVGSGTSERSAGRTGVPTSLVDLVVTEHQIGTPYTRPRTAGVVTIGTDLIAECTCGTTITWTASRLATSGDPTRHAAITRHIAQATANEAAERIYVLALLADTDSRPLRASVLHEAADTLRDHGRQP